MNVGFDLQPPASGLWFLLGAAAALLALAWLCRRLFQLYPRRQAALLLALKAFCVLLLLLALLRPTWVRSEADPARSRVLLLLDDSRSMRTPDGTGGARRLDEARGLAFERLLPALGEALPVETLAFAGAVRALQGPQMLHGDGERTDILQALEASAARQGAPGSLGACVLLTDGGEATELPASVGGGAPLFALAIGSDLAGLDDWRIESLEAPARVDEQSSFEVTVEIAASGQAPFLSRLHGERVTVSCNAQPVSAQPAGLSREKARQRVTFRLQAGKAGLYRYTAGLPALPGELSEANNSRGFSLEVQHPQRRVLYFSDHLGQEYKAFRNAVKSDPAIHFTGLVRAGPERYLLQGGKEGDGFGQSFPETAQALRPFCCVVLAGCAAEALGPAAHAALKEFVSAGGALVWLGGPKAFGRGGWAGSPLAALCPWELSPAEPPWRPEPTEVEPTALGRTHALLKDLEAAFRSGGIAGRWEGVNRPGPLRPGAQGLLQQAGSPGDRGALLALAHYGQGMVLGLASDSLWRISQQGGEGARVYSAFWRQGLRYLSGQETRSRLLKLAADRSGPYPPGSTALLTAQVLDRTLRPHAQATLTARLIGEEEPSGPQASPPLAVLFRPGLAPGSYQAQLPLAAPGLFRLQVSAADEQGVLESAELLLEAGAGYREGERLALNRTWLEALCASSGGRVFTPAQADDLIAAVREAVRPAIRRQERSLVWETPAFFLLFLGGLLTEWVVRRRMNLI